MVGSKKLVNPFKKPSLIVDNLIPFLGVFLLSWNSVQVLTLYLIEYFIVSTIALLDERRKQVYKYRSRYYGNILLLVLVISIFYYIIQISTHTFSARQFLALLLPSVLLLINNIYSNRGVFTKSKKDFTTYNKTLKSFYILFFVFLFTFIDWGKDLREGLDFKYYFLIIVLFKYFLESQVFND